MSYLFEVIHEYLEEAKPKKILELGAGFGTTPGIHDWAKKNRAKVTTLETASEWLNKMNKEVETTKNRTLKLVPEFKPFNLNEYPELSQEWDLVIVDNKSGESRQFIINKLAGSGAVLIVDDVEETFEPSASAYGYYFEDWISEIFKAARPAVAILKPKK